jgi:hypothetical protein
MEENIVETCHVHLGNQPTHNYKIEFARNHPACPPMPTERAKDIVAVAYDLGSSEPNEGPR